MSFINVAKQGVQGFSKYGKFIGEGKNNGIKVYQSLEPNGVKVFRSVNKEGELIKEIKHNKWATYIDNFVDGSKTTSERDLIRTEDGWKLKFDFNKQNKDGSSEGLFRTYNVPSNMDYHFGYKNTEEVMQHIRSPKGKMQVSISQRTPEGDSIALTKDFKTQRADIDVNGNFELAPEIALKDGKSSYFVNNVGDLSHADNSNKVELNLAQMLFDSAKKIWQ